MVRKKRSTNFWIAVVIVGVLAVFAINGSGLLEGFVTAGTRCGNSVCDAGETCITCAGDCGLCYCVDNDGGLNAKDYGTCETNAALLQEFSDYCQGEKVVEYYCDYDNTCTYTAINCVHGCSEGGCV